LAARMSDGNDKCVFLVGDECDVVWKSGQVDAPVAPRAQSPKQRMLNNRGARTFGTKSGTHRSGAICRSRANTSPAGMGLDSPALKRAMRRAISASQAAS